jgi:hypothetical protein
MGLGCGFFMAKIGLSDGILSFEIKKLFVFVAVFLTFYYLLLLTISGGLNTYKSDSSDNLFFFLTIYKFFKLSLC